MPFTNVVAEIVKLPGQLAFGIRKGIEKFWKVPGGKANGGVLNSTVSAFPQVGGCNGPVNTN